MNMQLAVIEEASRDLERALDECAASTISDELRGDLATIKGQLAKKEPRPGILAEAGKSIRSIAENVTAGLLTPGALVAAAALAKALGA